MTDGKDNYPPGVDDSDFDESSDMDMYIEIELTEGEIAQLRRHKQLNPALLDPLSRAILRSVFLQIVGQERERT